MPPGQFGYFVAGTGTGTTMPPGSQGVLCLTGGSIHRYAMLAQSPGPAGAFGIVADVGAVPGHGAIQPGETWNFQAWHRDENPGATSNFTDAVGVTFS